MSTKKGGTTKGPPKHQNKRAYKPFQDVKKNPKEPGGSDGQTFSPIAGVCLRCKEQLEWKRKYGKYKPLTQPTKCIWCQKRNVRSAYHAICSACANAKGACGKCCKQVSHVVGKGAEQEEAERRQLEEALAGMRERDRRSLLRAMERGSAKLEDPTAGGASKHDESDGSEVGSEDLDSDDERESSNRGQAGATPTSADARSNGEAGSNGARSRHVEADKDESDSESEWESQDGNGDENEGVDDGADVAETRGEGGESRDKADKSSSSQSHVAQSERSQGDVAELGRTLADSCVVNEVQEASRGRNAGAE